MTAESRCPMCADGVLQRREGRLEQSGNTYLPTSVWSCGICGYARWEPALGAAWRPLDLTPALPRAA